MFSRWAKYVYARRTGRIPTLRARAGTSSRQPRLARDEAPSTLQYFPGFSFQFQNPIESLHGRPEKAPVNVAILHRSRPLHLSEWWQRHHLDFVVLELYR